MLPEITPQTPLDRIGGSSAADVTGGMAGKVREMLRLAKSLPGLEVLIFSGEDPGWVGAALEGKAVPGTWIRSA